MARNEDGEYELLVGNRQLLSVVFVLMVLFGIFFSLGYFVGRNSAPEPVRAQQPAQSGGVTQPKEPPPAAQPLEPGEAKVAPDSTAADTAAPASETPAESKPEPAPPQPAPVASVKVSLGPQPQPGQVFLQVRAVKRSDAEILADVLKRKGFQALVAPVVVDGVASDALFRVLVGPFRDADQFAKTRSELEAAGFKNPIRRQY